MLRFIHFALMTVTLIVAFGSPSFAQAPQGQKIGSLSCRLSPSIGLILGSNTRMACRFVPDGPFPAENYAGVWIWAMAYRPERGWGFSGKDGAPPVGASEIEDLRRRISELERNYRGASADKARETVGG